MNPRALRSERLRSHRLSAPASSVSAAADHMLAVQSQEFLSGRWALAARATGTPGRRAVDALFDGGTLIRSWTQRGTLHILPARDLGWVLSVTGERQLRQSSARHRQLGLGEEEFVTIERAVVAALCGGNALTREELFSVLSAEGIDPREQRGVHAIQYLAVRGVLCQGPILWRGRAACPARSVSCSSTSTSGNRLLLRIPGPSTSSATSSGMARSRWRITCGGQD